MYCPTCGSNNQDDLKYCTHCGTNLAVVSEALDGKFADLALSDVERIALLKDYYRGRRSAVIGFITVAISAFKLSLSSFLGNPDLSLWLVPLFLLLAVMGLFATVWGAGLSFFIPKHNAIEIRAGSLRTKFGVNAAMVNGLGDLEKNKYDQSIKQFYLGAAYHF